MTRDTNAFQGGSKKFLYTGPKKKTGFPGQDEDVDDRHWSYNTNNSAQNNVTSTSTEFDLDGIWSIKKNIQVPKEPGRFPQASQDGSDRNVGKGFYSRHTEGASSEITTRASPMATENSGKTWPRSYNYSYGSSTSQENKALSPRFNKDFTRVDSQSRNMSHTQGGGASNSQSTYSVQRGGRPDNRHLDF